MAQEAEVEGGSLNPVAKALAEARQFLVEPDNPGLGMPETGPDSAAGLPQQLHRFIERAAAFAVFYFEHPEVGARAVSRTMSSSAVRPGVRSVRVETDSRA